MATEVAVKRPGLRDLMPNVAKWVDAKRVEYGKDHVRDCIERGMRGEPGWFYAMEAGHVQGTPFEACQASMDLCRLYVAVGGKWAGFMRSPKVEVTNGTH